MSARKCKTPGAYWFFEKKDWSPGLTFSVSVPREVLEKIGARQAAALEKAFHDAIEPLLAPIWVKPAKTPTDRESTYLRMPSKEQPQ